MPDKDDTENQERGYANRHEQITSATEPQPRRNAATGVDGPTIEFLMKVPVKLPKDSALIGDRELKSLSAAEGEEIMADTKLYPRNKGRGKHTSLQCHPIVQAVSENWVVLGLKSPVRSYELLGRCNVAKTSINANKFFGPVYGRCSQSGKLDFNRACLLTRQQCELPTMNINILPGLWALVVDDEEAREVVCQCIKNTDFPEIQQYGDDGKVILGPHTQETKNGIKAIYTSSGCKASVDDWKPLKEYCNNTEFVDEMSAYIKEVKVETTLTMAVFNIRMTSDQSPEFDYLNKQAQRWLEVEPQEELRKQCVEAWTRWSQQSMFITWEATVEQEHLDSWQELKDSEISNKYLNDQGSKMNATTVPIEAAETAHDACLEVVEDPCGCAEEATR